MKIHIVQKGDTLWNLSKQYGVDFQELKEVNTQLSNPEKIMPGMKIKIPSTAKQVKKETIAKEAQQPKKKETQHPYKHQSPTPIAVVKEDEYKKEKPVKEMQTQPKMPAMPSMPSMPILEKPKEQVKKEKPKEKPKVKPKEKPKEKPVEDFCPPGAIQVPCPPMPCPPMPCPPNMGPAYFVPCPPPCFDPYFAPMPMHHGHGFYPPHGQVQGTSNGGGCGCGGSDASTMNFTGYQGNDNHGMWQGNNFGSPDNSMNGQQQSNTENSMNNGQDMNWMLNNMNQGQMFQGYDRPVNDNYFRPQQGVTPPMNDGLPKNENRSQSNQHNPQLNAQQNQAPAHSQPTFPAQFIDNQQRSVYPKPPFYPQSPNTSS